MPIVDDVGFGDCTPLKMQHFSKIVAMHLVVTEQVLSKHPAYRQTYRYIDLTAGKGYSPNGLNGSPIEFLLQLEDLKSRDKFTHPCRVDLIERNKNNLADLKEAIDKERARNGWVDGNCNFFGRMSRVV